MAWVRIICGKETSFSYCEPKSVGNAFGPEKTNDCAWGIDVMDIKLDENLKKIIEEGDDVVIRKKKRDGKLVYIVYQQTLKIRAIIPCDK